MSDNNVTNPFNTETGQKPPRFVGRKVEMDKFKRNLRDTIEGKPRHLAIIGDYGMGKTVLLWQFGKCITQAGHYSILIQSYTVKSFREFYNLLLNELVKVVPKPRVKAFKDRLEQVGLSIIGTGITIGLREKDFEPQSGLLAILEEAYQVLERKESSQPVLVIFIDDMHLIAQSLERQILEIFRNVFTKLGREGCRIMLVTAGLPQLFPQLEDMHEAIVRFLEPQRLAPLNQEEIAEAVEVPTHRHGVSWEKPVIEEIYESSQGNPYFVQLLSYYAFEHREGNRISILSYQKGLSEALEHLAVTKFGNMYETASEEERKVIYALFNLGKASTFTEIVKMSQKIGVAEGTARKLLVRLYKDKQILRRDNAKYDFWSKIFRLWLDKEKPFLSNGTISR